MKSTRHARTRRKLTLPMLPITRPFKKSARRLLTRDPPAAGTLGPVDQQRGGVGTELELWIPGGRLSGHQIERRDPVALLAAYGPEGPACVDQRCADRQFDNVSVRLRIPVVGNAAAGFEGGQVVAGLTADMTELPSGKNDRPVHGHA